MGVLHGVLYVSVPLRAAWNEVAYLDLLLVLPALACYGYGFWRYRSRYRQIGQALLEDIDPQTAPSLTSSGEDVRILALCLHAQTHRNESERGALQCELREQRDLLASWAHEVKTPLSVCQLILSRNEAEPVRSQLLEQLERIESQIRILLHVERLRHLDQSLIMQRLAVPDVLRAAIARSAPMMQARGLELELDAPPVEAMGDEQCVDYILDQLLTNVAKYAPEGSSIGLRAQQSEKTALLSVANAGEIPQQHILRVFDKGFSGARSDARSSGMGLYYAQQTALAQGGCIRVTSEAGQTIFTLELPRFQSYLRPALQA